MTYIILAAGKGTNLYPLTLKHPKSLYKLDDGTSVLQHIVRTIRKYDKEAEIVIVVGYMYKHIMNELASENVRFVHNPFYSITGSIASLWFAKQFLQRENIAIINGDVVIENKLAEELLCRPTDTSFVLVDSNKKSEGKYNVQIQGEKVCVMSKRLTNYFAIYSSITVLDAVSARFLLEEMDNMVNNGVYELFFEDVLVQMIFENNFELFYKDIKDYSWVEVDSVDDLIKAKLIHCMNCNC